MDIASPRLESELERRELMANLLLKIKQIDAMESEEELIYHELNTKGWEFIDDLTLNNNGPK